MLLKIAKAVMGNIFIFQKRPAVRLAFSVYRLCRLKKVDNTSGFGQYYLCTKKGGKRWKVTR
ncbi:hypothetical protein FUAX_29710 [Fulvitalea axinellae]|uniref:Uncharacterized protein n=1 Tax=Fulvitalea axinellae TaxID=1182444 RepID=A0AAU9CVL5_9BACT|nr:hypothetical protein FUAX_29710 [Fulvitalea axinellae]